MWVSGHIFGVKYAHALVIFFKAGDVIKLAIFSILLCSLNYKKFLRANKFINKQINKKLLDIYLQILLLFMIT